MPKTFGAANLPVKARRIQRPRRYSDVIVLKYENGEAIDILHVSAERPKGNPNRWEPELVPKKVAA
jgi:hypothetical protein